MVPNDINTGLPAPKVRLVDHIVMDQRGCMDHFRNHRDFPLRRQKTTEKRIKSKRKVHHRRIKMDESCYLFLTLFLLNFMSRWPCPLDEFKATGGIFIHSIVCTCPKSRRSHFEFYFCIFLALFYYYEIKLDNATVFFLFFRLINL